MAWAHFLDCCKLNLLVLMLGHLNQFLDVLSVLNLVHFNPKHIGYFALRSSSDLLLVDL